MAFALFEVVRVEPRHDAPADVQSLSSTGEFRSRDDYYDGTSIRVSRDGRAAR